MIYEIYIMTYIHYTDRKRRKTNEKKRIIERKTIRRKEKTYKICIPFHLLMTMDRESWIRNCGMRGRPEICQGSRK